MQRDLRLRQTSHALYARWCAVIPGSPGKPEPAAVRNSSEAAPVDIIAELERRMSGPTTRIANHWQDRSAHLACRRYLSDIRLAGSERAL